MEGRREGHAEDNVGIRELSSAYGREICWSKG